jgi:hypothetical protein
MSKKLINEDIQNIKYLFGYKPGRVISEQVTEMTEDKDDLFLRRRSSTIENLIDKYINEVEEEETLFSDEYEFADNIISWVVQDLTTSDYSDHDYDKLTDLIKDEFGDYILSQYVESDFDNDEDNLFEQEEPENDRYMFFSNLQQIHRQMGILLEKDPEMIHSILENGHDWAQDHIAKAKESIDQVFDFIMNEEEGDGEEMFEGYEYDDVDEVNPDDFNDDNENDLNQLKQKHGIKFRKDFEGSDDEFIDYLYDNKDSFDNFKKDNNRIKIPTDPIVFDPTDDETSQLKQKHGVKFRDEFEGDDDEFMDYLYDNRGSFDNFSKDLKDLRQTKRNR